MVNKGENHAFFRRNARHTSGRVADYVQLCKEGFSALGHEARGGQMVVSVSEQLGRVDERQFFENWNVLPTPSGLQRRRFGIRTGTIAPSSSLDVWITNVERASNFYNGVNILYVAQINTRALNTVPSFPIARIWNECLGPAAIPFDPAARKALIEHGCQHSELKRHIEAWEEMKASKSRYAVGDRLGGTPMAQ
jgi:hypothetical protein